MTERAKVAYDAFLSGFEKFAPPQWNELPARLQDALKVAYLQGKLDAEAPASTQALHPDTAKLVTEFADALATKLRAAEVKYSHTNGWLTDDWEYSCHQQLQEHMLKGDPLDVAAYLAFMWRRGWSTNPARRLRRPGTPPLLAKDAT